MNAKETYETVKAHVIRHKEAYIIGGISVIAIAFILVVKNKETVIYKFENEGPAFASKNQTNNYTIISPGNSGNVIEDTTTGIIYPSQNAVAKALGFDQALVSKHLNGKIPDLRGHVLEKIVDGVKEYELVRH